MSTAHRIIASLAALFIATGGGYLSGRRSVPARVETREKMVERVVTKEVVRWKTREVARRDVHREEEVVTRPDGTREDRVTTDSHAARDSSAVSSASRDSVLDASRTRQEVATRDSQPRWMLGVTASSSLTLGHLAPSWGVEGKVRVLGPFWLGAQVTPVEKWGTVSLGVSW